MKIVESKEDEKLITYIIVYRSWNTQFLKNIPKEGHIVSMIPTRHRTLKTAISKRKNFMFLDFITNTTDKIEIYQVPTELNLTMGSYYSMAHWQQNNLITKLGNPVYEEYINKKTNEDYERGYRAGRCKALQEAYTEADAKKTTNAFTGLPITMTDIMNTLDFEENEREGTFERQYGNIQMVTDKKGHPIRLEVALEFPPISSKNYSTSKAVARLNQFSKLLGAVKRLKGSDPMDIEYFESKIEGMKLAINELKETGSITRETCVRLI